MHLESYPELAYTSSVAGWTVLTNRSAKNLDRSPISTGKVEVVFTREEADLNKVSRTSWNDESGGSWYQLPDNEAIPAFFRSDGQVVLVQEPATITLDYSAQLRRVVPFAVALQNELILHASAIRWNQGVISFIGSSGAGKTSLAGRLADLGPLLIADDLLPCRTSGERVLVPVVDNPGNSCIQIPLTILFFLNKSNSLDKIDLAAISKRDCFLSLLSHGFGELPAAKAWKTQFVNYHNIAEQVQAFCLKIPFGDRFLDEAVRMLFYDILPRN